MNRDGHEPQYGLGGRIILASWSGSDLGRKKGIFLAVSEPNLASKDELLTISTSIEIAQISLPNISKMSSNDSHLQMFA